MMPSFFLTVPPLGLERRKAWVNQKPSAGERNRPFKYFDIRLTETNEPGQTSKGSQSLDSILENQDEFARSLLSKMCMCLAYTFM